MAEPTSKGCGCGEDDCELFFFGYHYCSAPNCGEHHRPPVATPDEPWCPVDFNMAYLEELDRLPADAPIDHDAVASKVRERFVATATQGPAR